MKKISLTLFVLLVSLVVQAQELKQGNLSNITRLTSGDVTYDNPQWSPNGKKIAFTVGGSEGLFVINPDGTGMKQISDASGVGFMYQWSADSREILVRDTRWEDNETAIGLRRHAIWAIDLEGNKVRLSQDAEYMQPAAWRYSETGVKRVVAPDAVLIQKRMKPLASDVAVAAAKLPVNNISFYCDGENLYKVDAIGNKVLINKGTSLCPTLSPDGKKVAFNQMNDIVIMDIDGTNKVFIGRGFYPTWVNNSQIVFQKTTDDGHDFTTGELYMATINGGNIKQLTNTSSVIEMQPQVSPDGKKIVFCSYTDGQIYIADFK